MASRRLALSVVIILLALECSSAECYEGNDGIERKGQRDSKTGKDALPQSDTKFIWGRKMLQGLDEKPVYVPGKSKLADLDNPVPEFETESDRVQAQQHSQKSMSQATLTSSGNASNMVDKHDHYITKKNVESKAFLEAADEVANLMRKDYKGGDRPRRKPPINNHEPKN